MLWLSPRKIIPLCIDSSDEMLKAFKRKSSARKEAKIMAEASQDVIQPREAELVVVEAVAEVPEKQTKRDIFNEYMYVCT